MKHEKTSCRAKFVGNLEKEFTEILIKQMSENVSLETAQPKDESPEYQFDQILGTPLHSSFCVNVVILTNNSTQVFLTTVTTESIHRRLEMLHFIFLGSQSFLLKIWQEKSIQRLKFKTGLITNNGLILSQRESAVSDSQEVKVQSQLPQSSRKWNSIRNQQLSIAIFKLPPYVLLDRDDKPIMGMTYDFIQELHKIYNASVVVHISRSKLGKSQNGTWEGFMGDLVTGKKDMMAGIGLIPTRFEVLDFSSPFYYGSMNAFLSHPKITVKWQAIVFPFDRTVWLLVFIIFILSIPLFYIHLKLKRSNDTEPTNNIFLAIIIPFSALMVQGGGRIPPRARLLTVMTIFYAIIVGQFYSSNLISFLTFPEPEVIPRSFEDLSNRNDYAIYSLYFPGGVTHVFFNTTKIKTFTKIRERMIDMKEFLKCAELAIFTPKASCISFPFVLDTILPKISLFIPGLTHCKAPHLVRVSL
ncbi:unnamed protein product [Allacma fusca]|uniref:Ionotropic receptor n=1 Tax=Allacma fusca TaxID=39272 RepID=A0A8J2Q759_9HEXA|nr:unnamed protein product [Allacma fusca]